MSGFNYADKDLAEVAMYSPRFAKAYEQKVSEPGWRPSCEAGIDDVALWMICEGYARFPETYWGKAPHVFEEVN